VATAWLLADLLRRSFALPLGAHRVALLLSGLVVATPAHGVVWLAGERVGMVMVPCLFVLALHWLHGEGRFRTRACGALALAALAPYCHAHGILVPFALLPALLAAARRSGSERVAAWIGTLVLLGNVAAATSLRTAAPFDLTPPEFAALRDLVERVGRTFGDLLPGSRVDDAGLGLATLLALVLLPWCGDRSAIARQRAAVWWSGTWFAVGLLLLDAVRFGAEPPSGTWTEATFGACLLPLGVVGIVACRFGLGTLWFAAGAGLVLAVQGWQQGLDELRLARARGERVAASMALPTGSLGGEPEAVLRDPTTLPALRARGLLPAAVEFAPPSAAATAHGRVTHGDAQSVQGSVRSTLRWPGIALVLAVDADRPQQRLGVGWPDFATAGPSRDVPWTIRFAAPLAPGSRVAVFGFQPGPGCLCGLGAPLVLRDGGLVAEAPR
jgi:hypothetical protein